MTTALLDMLRWSTADDAIAIAEPERSTTYAELERRSELLAADLRALGVRREAVVGIHLGRSAAAIISALAVLKAGGAYLPIDPAQPRERSEFELRDAAAHAVITAADPTGAPAFAACRTLTLEAAGTLVGQPSGDRFAPVVRRGDASGPDDLAYVMYTSGSTGRPKGVEITCRSLTNLVAWHCAAFGVTRADRASHLCAVGFDAAVWEVWPYLASGATIVIADDTTAKDAHALRDWLLENRVTIGFVPTALAERLIGLAWPARTPLRTLLTGADTLRAFPPPGLPFELINNYGPTEATVVATSGRVRPHGETVGDAPSIGSAIANVSVLIVGNDGAPVADGTAGEIWIGGAGLARGYRNRPELTAQCFVSGRTASGAAGRFYRTGDRARRGAAGELIFLGRGDEQINLRGYRIEPAEVEAALQAHPAIRACAVVLRTSGAADDRLVAYAAADAPTLPPLRELQAFLAATLPAYMIPSAVVALPDLPLTARGKIDRTALRTRRDEPPHVPGAAFSAARTATERRLTDIVGPLFGGVPVSVDDNLIAIGGHSLLLTKLVARVQDAFGVRLALRRVFDAPTVGGLAAEIDRLAASAIDAAARGAPIPRRSGGLHR